MPQIKIFPKESHKIAVIPKWKGVIYCAFKNKTNSCQETFQNQNFFQPVMRLKEKKRDGARVTGKYDRPKTSYERVLEYPEIKVSVKKKLRKRFLKLNPKALLKEITALGEGLSRA